MKKQNVKSIALALMLAFCLATITGCGGAGQAIRTSIEYRQLQVETRYVDSNPTMLEAKPGDTVAVLVNESTPYEVKDEVISRITNELTNKGYDVVPANQDPDYTIRVLLQDQEQFKSAREMMGGNDNTGALAGTVGGAAIGASGTGSASSAVAGGIIGGAIGVASDFTSSMVKVGEHRLFVTYQVFEQREGSVRTTQVSSQDQGHAGISQEVISEENIFRHGGQFYSSAKKANLKWEDAQEPLVGAVSSTIGNMFF